MLRVLREVSVEGVPMERNKAFWRAQLVGLPGIDLCTDRPRQASSPARTDAVKLEVDGNDVMQVQALARQAHTTSFTVLLAAFKALLYRYTGTADITVGTPRSHSPLHHATDAELLERCLVLRTEVVGDLTFMELLDRVRKSVGDAYRHQDIDLRELMRELAPDRDLSGEPLFRVLFSVDRLGEAGAGDAGAVSSVMPAPLDMHLELFEGAGSLSGEFRYAARLFDRETILHLGACWSELLRQLCRDPGVVIGEAAMLSATQRARVLGDANNTHRPFAFEPVQNLIARRAAIAPQAFAVVCDGGQLTYEQLDERSSRLGELLGSFGISSDCVVGICLERSLDLVVGLLAILKAGGAYLPLDPRYPRERLNHLVRDSRARLVLTRGSERERFAEAGCAAVCIEALLASPGSPSPTRMAASIHPQNLAYVIYTSGSTGEPKGVHMSHGALCNHLRWLAEDFALNTDDVLLQRTPLSFDASVWEIFHALASGARLVLSPAGDDSPDTLWSLCERHAVTVLQMVPSLLREFVDDPTTQRRLPALRHVFSGGEALTSELATKVCERLGVRLHNLYGPTETCIQTATYSCPPTPDTMGLHDVPIGRPIANARCYVLDSRLEPLPAGAPGELYVGGAGLARGYGGRGGTTAVSFVASPFGHGERIYRTGDRVRVLGNGNLQFLSRYDHQVKLRGYRIEPAEIEAALLQEPAIKQAVVVVRNDPEERRLVAYVVPRATHVVDVAVVRAQLRQRLPQYLVPASIIVLQTLPLNASLKVDRATLARGRPGSCATGSRLARPQLNEAYVAPRTGDERILVGIWEAALGVEPIGVLDDFFNLGGNSLAGVRVLRAVREQFASDMTLLDLFSTPTITAMAAILAEEVVIEVDGQDHHLEVHPC